MDPTTATATKPRPAAFASSFTALPRRMHASIAAFLSPRSQASLASATKTDNKGKGRTPAGGGQETPTVAGRIVELK